MGLNILLYFAKRDFSSQKRLQRYSVFVNWEMGDTGGIWGY